MTHGGKGKGRVVYDYARGGDSHARQEEDEIEEYENAFGGVDEDRTSTILPLFPPFAAPPSPLDFKSSQYMGSLLFAFHSSDHESA